VKPQRISDETASVEMHAYTTTYDDPYLYAIRAAGPRFVLAFDPPPGLIDPEYLDEDGKLHIEFSAREAGRLLGAVMVFAHELGALGAPDPKLN
jgi:hypothetical protein